MARKALQLRPVPPGSAAALRPAKEPRIAQLSSFVGFFVYLLILKSFLLPLFVIPTGSMAETLYGQYAPHTCPNCGVEYPVNQPFQRAPIVQCPNCRWREYAGSAYEMHALMQSGTVDAPARAPLPPRAGDRIMVHGWTYDCGGRFAPQRWDVVVFKVPTDGLTNYIKRLIGRPGETVEIIDGDIFITPPGGSGPALARKPDDPQHSLWFRYYDHDHPPLQVAAGARFHPRWSPLQPGSPWTALETRRPRFDGLGGGFGEILFVSAPGPTDQPGLVQDIYGYNNAPPSHIVSDVRLGCRIQLEAAEPDGFVELSSTKHGDRFVLRLYADHVTLAHASGTAEPEVWGRAEVAALGGAVHVSLANVDHQVIVAVDGRPVLRTTPEQYDIDAETARELSRDARPPRLVIAARNVRATFEHLLIERDVYYTNDGRSIDGGPGYGTQGNPITLGPHSYYVLGDNSPASCDCRFSFMVTPQTDPVGPHLARAYAAGEYQLGTVPADQLIGPAFLVYFPGLGPVLPPEFKRSANIRPEPGLIRWIR